MTSKHAWMPGGSGPAWLAAGLFLLVLVYAGSANHVARGQPPDNPPRESVPAPPGEAARQAAAAENRDSINFPRVLALAAGQNPQVAFANEQIHEAFAQLRGAQALWLPSLRAGVYYGNHDGPFQADDGTIVESHRSTLEAGMGMAAVGGGSPAIPGVAANFRMTDAVFQPRIAGQEVAARRQAATAATHDILLFAAVAYLDLLRACQQHAIAQDTLDHTRQLAETTAAFARTGQGNQADADRAETELALRKNALAQAVVQTRIASARLVQLLSLPPDRVLVPEEPGVGPIELVSAERSGPQLVADGLSRRPELTESRDRIVQASADLDREQYAPLLPSVVLGISQGGYGGGPGDTLADFHSRFDLDATAYWQLRNFGAGDLAARKAARSRLEQAKILETRIADQVAREIVEAHAQAESLRGQIAVATAAIDVAAASYRRNLQRIRGGQGLPLEVLQSIQALDQSRREYLRAVGDYDEWQFRLYRALGCPIPSEANPAR
ncbi:MAG: TolC family protein [Thermoguttaceae bacterium]|jgi:outer membrane protein TolC